MSPWARAPVASIVSFDNTLFKHEVQDLSGFILLLLIRLQLGVLVHDLLKEGELLLNRLLGGEGSALGEMVRFVENIVKGEF